MGNRQIDEFLVVGVAAGDGGFGGDFCESRMAVERIQYVFSA